MIEIKYEILPLALVGFLLEMIHPVLEINNIDPNLIAALRVSFPFVSLFFPSVHSHPAHARSAL